MEQKGGLIQNTYTRVDETNSCLWPSQGRVVVPTSSEQPPLKAGYSKNLQFPT